jgi:microcystin-dependent protein
MATGFTKKVNQSLINMPYDLDLIGTIKKWVSATAPTGWMLCDGTAISRTTYAELFALMPYLSQTVTMTQASPCVVTMTAHGLQTGQTIQFTTTGGLYTGLAVGTVYYIRWASADTFNLYDTEAHAVNTAATTGVVNTSGSQSGVHTGIAYKWGNGDGSTTFNVPDFRGASVAGVGTSGNGYLAAETFVLGAKYNDTMQGHYHDIADSTYGLEEYYAGAGTGGFVATASNNRLYKARTIETDGTNGTPRKGTVTRGKVVGVNFIIKAYNVVKTVYAQGVDGARLSIDGTFATNSDSLVPSEKATGYFIRHPLTAGKTDDYTNTDTDGLLRVEYDTTSKACAHTLPLIANNIGRRIEVAYVKGGTNNVTISPNAANANTLSNDGLATIILCKVGDFVVFQHSSTSGMWEIVNERITSELRLDGYAGYGGTDTKIPYFTTTTTNIGNMHTLTTNNNTNGCKITINRSGRYSFTLVFAENNSVYLGMTLNSAALTTAMSGITDATRIAYGATLSADTALQVNAVRYFSKNDIIRPHTNGGATSVPSRCWIICSYLGM